MNNLIVELTEANFATQVLSSEHPVLVDFWADWCGPCKTLAPILDEIAVEYQDKLIVAKLNIDHHGAIAANYQVRSIPTLLLFQKGEVTATQIGVRSKAQLNTFLQAQGLSK